MSTSFNIPQINSPFTAKSTAEQVSAGIDLSGKNIIVTGGTSGIGYETVRVLALRGANIWTTSRHSNAQSIIDELRSKTNNQNIHLLTVDFTSFESVRSLASQIKALNIPIHILILNAGVMGPKQYTLTKDGFELHFQVNHLSHFLLTQLILPQLIQGSARVVVVSSLAHKWSNINFNDINSTQNYDKFKAYGQSKTANPLFAYELNKRYASQGISAFSLHPGVIATNLSRDLSQDELAQYNLIELDGTPAKWLKTVHEGASTT
jgi:NAD(P)-dependent dehydrogenase (short-subunit alcohol dehydrogenase family)